MLAEFSKYAGQLCQRSSLSSVRSPSPKLTQLLVRISYQNSPEIDLFQHFRSFLSTIILFLISMIEFERIRDIEFIKPLQTLRIFVITRENLFTRRVKALWASYGRFKISSRSSPTGSDNRGSSSPLSERLRGRGGEKEGRGSIEIVSRTVRRFGRKKGGHSWEASAAQFGNLFLAGSPDRRMLDEGGVRVHSRSELGRSVPPTISELIKLSRRPSVHD